MRRCVLLALLAVVTGAPAAQAVAPGGTALVDRPTGFGALPFDGIGESSVSGNGITADGRYVVIASQSNSLLAGDEDTALNVYRIDLTNGQVVQVDTSAGGAQPNPGSTNFSPSISADGNHVGFYTTSPTIDPAASPTNPEFVVKNLATGGVELATRGNGPAGAPVTNLGWAVLSGDGRHVAFTTNSAVQADNATGVAGSEDAYLRSLDANTTHMESVKTPAGTEGGGVRGEVSVDYGGDAVGFTDERSLTAGDTDTSVDAYIHIASPDQTVLASFSPGQTAGADGANNRAAVAGGPGNLDVAWDSGAATWIAPCTTVCTTPATRADHAKTGGTDSNSNTEDAFFPAAAGTALPGRVYWTTYSALDPADTDNTWDVYGWDIGNVNYDSSIHLMTGAPSGGVFGGSASADGSAFAFTSSSPSLPGTNGAVNQAFVRKGGVSTNVSQPLGQAPRTDEAGSASISTLHDVSDDGRIVAFTSNAPALGAPATPTGIAGQVFARDVATGITQILSTAPDGTPGNGNSSRPSVDAAGDRVVFESSASNLVPGDENGSTDVFLRDLTTGKTTLVDRTAGGGVPLNGASGPTISADGSKVVFLSRSADIPGAPLDGLQHAYEVDLASGGVTLIDRAGDGSVANGSALLTDVDGDGQRVLFASSAPNLGGGTRSLYLRDLTDPAHLRTIWVSAPQDGSPSDDNITGGSIDRAGDRVAFAESDSGFGFGMTPGGSQIFLRDLNAQTTTLVSVGAGGPVIGGASGPSLSADGTRLSFTSFASSLPGALPEQANVYVRDLAAGTTTLASTRNNSPESGRFGSSAGSLSGNGQCLAFTSTSDDLVAGGYSSDFQHVYLHALGAGCPAGAAPPAIKSFSLTHKRFAVGSKPTAVSSSARPHRKKPKKAPKGTAFKIVLSEAATTRIAITRKVKGHRAGGKGKVHCKPAKRHQRRNCTRVVAIVTLSRSGTKAGGNTIPFSGRIRKKRLAKGSYMATATAIDAAGNSSQPRSARFTVVG